MFTDLVCVAGGFIATLGVFCSIWSPNIYILVLTYGVIGGIGISLVWMPTMVSPSYYFTKKRALATSKYIVSGVYLIICSVNLLCVVNYIPLLNVFL